MATQKCLVLMAHMVLGLYQVGDHLQPCRIHLDDELDIDKILNHLEQNNIYHCIGTN